MYLTTTYLTILYNQYKHMINIIERIIKVFSKRNNNMKNGVVPGTLEVNINRAEPSRAEPSRAEPGRGARYE